MIWLNDNLPDDAIICNGAGNYASWIHRYFRFRRYGSHFAPSSATMGYGVPAAVAIQRLYPERLVVSINGDGDFLMNGQEFATAVQYELPIVVVVCDNASYGTIRMHQERNYPTRVVGTDLRNPDFSAYARAFSGFGARRTNRRFRGRLPSGARLRSAVDHSSDDRSRSNYANFESFENTRRRARR
jgi:acetolactate synthase-1/2/3 large subunit